MKSHKNKIEIKFTSYKIINPISCVHNVVQIPRQSSSKMFHRLEGKQKLTPRSPFSCQQLQLHCLTPRVLQITGLLSVCILSVYQCFIAILLYGQTTFVYSIVCGHLDCFYHLTIMNNVMKIQVHDFGWASASNSLYILARVESLDYLVIQSLTF